MSDTATNPGAEVESQSPPVEGPAVTTVTSHFKLVFVCVMVITVLSLVASVSIGIFVSKPTDAAKSAMETCTTLAKLGFGAIVGLLGGKAVQ